MTMVKPELMAYVERRKAVLAAVRRMLLVSLGLRRAPEELDPDTSLFGTGLGIDSVDAVELIIALETEFNVKLHDPVERKLALRSVNSLVDCILAEEARRAAA
jgi:acyl carrier protein